MNNSNPKPPDKRYKPEKTDHCIKAVLFDFDGTLTLPGALNFAAIKNAIDCPPDIAILEYIESVKDPSDKERFTRVLDEAEELASRQATPNFRAEEILSWLKSKDVRLGIITRNSHKSVIRSLENFARISLADFDIVVSREDSVPPKPSPEGINLAMERMGVNPGETVMVGDYLFDMAAGNSAGATTVLIPAADEQRDFSSWGQDHLITCLIDLKPIVEFHLPLPVGKLPNRFLSEALASLTVEDPSVLIAPGIGEDTTAIDIDREAILILKSDPITFVSDAAARYAVTVNANDIATSGALPRWFLSTLLFPPETTPSAILTTMSELQDFCCQQGITLCGGHTEITDAVKRPVISGMIAGTVSRKRLVDKKCMSEGDRVLMTKTAGIEGTSILAQEFKNQLLTGGLSQEEITTGKQFLEQLSVLREAAIAADCDGVTAMHDVTEGGLATALEELSQAGNHAISVDMDKIPVHDLTHRMCTILNLDPLGLIGSGTLLISCREPDAASVIKNLEAADIQVCQIGTVLDVGSGIKAVASGSTVEWPVFKTDELARLYG